MDVMAELLPSGTPAPGDEPAATPVPVRFAELDPELSPEVRTWAGELRKIWAATGMSLNRFASGHPIDKGTLSHYLDGKRVPRDPWFLNKLLAILVEQGKEVSQEVREHLTELQLRALQAAHPHEYRVRRVSDELELAEIAKYEADRHARTLEAQVAGLIRRNNELNEQLRRLRSTGNAERAVLQTEKSRLEQEIADLNRRLEHVRRRIVAAGRRRQDLDNLLDRLDE